MLEFIKNVISNTTFLTVLSGVLVYVLNQYFVEEIINPRKRFKQLKERILYTIALYSCYYHNPYNLLNKESNIRVEEEYREASKEMRKIGSELAGYIGLMPKFKKIEKLRKVQGAIIGISNSFFMTSNEIKNYEIIDEYEKIIKENL